ncbi:MAG: putative tricarboxylic transport membrane protein [Hyphomicrobiaceae bacterium]|jgi:putative tricarboxylic transport membrane protein
MEFLTHAAEAFTWINVVVSVAGMLAGIFLGALPGLSSTFACAVMLPVTFSMAPVTALIFLGTIYMGSTYGGSFAAILVNTPGTPQSISTTFDGFPMAQRGDGGLALSIACVSSVVGGLIGIAAFLWLAPPLAQIALLFGPAEYFWLALFGLTIIASLSEGNLLKGMISGFLGLLLSQIGISVVSGDARFTYESTALVGGISIIPATIGLLCLPVVIDLISDAGHHLKAPLNGASSRIGEAARAVWKQKVNLARSSILGTIIGIIPAAGGAVASLVAYAEASRASSTDEDYGKGEPGGVVASESANNATVGSGLIPTFVLGIPGTPPDAVILGAMLVHGVQIGPKLFTEHGNVVYTFVAGMLFATLLMLPIGLFLGRYIYKVVIFTPKTFLVPTVAMMTLIGAFAIQNNYHDVVLMLGLGITAWILSRFGFPPAPIVLGLLLGPIAEQGFAQSVMIGEAKGDVFGMFFGNALSLTLIAAIIASIVLPSMIKNHSGRRYRIPSHAAE